MIKHARGLLAACLAGAWIFALAGCDDSGKTVTLRYDRPPKYDVPQSVRKLAVMEFECSPNPRDPWGQVASDKLVSLLDAQNKRFDRYRLYDRSRLAAVMAERDIKIASATSAAEARNLGKAADVDAIIFGKVAASVQDTRHVKYDQQGRPKPYVQRTGHVSVSFNLISVATTTTIAADSFSASYDSQNADQGGMAQFLKAINDGIASQDLKSPQQIIDDLLSDAVAKFVQTISPWQQEITVKLDKGKTKNVESGNAMAVAGDYKTALGFYQQGLVEEPEDNGAMFNAGVMCEVLLDFPRAEQYYRQAAMTKPKEKKYTERLNEVLRIRAAGANQ